MAGAREAVVVSQSTHVLPLEFNRRYPVIVRGDGVWVEDASGNRYLDAMSGGAVAAAFLLAADATTILAGSRLTLATPAVNLPAGLLAVLLAIVPAALGPLAGQAAVPVGFGRRAGAWTAAGSAVAAIAILAFLAVIS